MATRKRDTARESKAVLRILGSEIERSDDVLFQIAVVNLEMKDEEFGEIYKRVNASCWFPLFSC